MSEKNIQGVDLKLICKGKWYLYSYLTEANKQIKKLSAMCKNSEIPQCKSCRVGNFDDCFYKYKGGYQTSGIYNDILEYVDETECQDIIQRFKALK